MKKSLLIITSAFVGASAFATLPVLEEAMMSNDVKSEKSAQLDNFIAQKVKSESVNGPRKKFGPVNGYTLYPVVSVPSVPFYMNGLTLNTGLEVAPIVVPPYTAVQYGRNIYATGQGTGTPPWDDVTVSWKYADMLADFEEKTSTEKAITITYPAMDQLTTWKAPEMTATFQGTTSEAVVVPYTVAIGGQSVLYLSHKDDDGNTVTGPKAVGFNTCAQGHGIMFSNRQCQTCRFGTSGYSNREDTFDDYLGEFAMSEYASDFKSQTGKTLTKATAAGYGVSMGYSGVPYILKKLTLYAYSDLPSDVTCNVTIYKADAQGMPTTEIVKEQKVVVPANKPDEGYVLRSDIPVTFTSKDEDGFELDYMVIDSPLFIQVTGITNNKSIKSFAPWIFAYEQGTQYYYKSNSYTIFELEGEGTKAQVFYDNGTYTWTGSTSNHNWRGSYVDVEAEVPYLVPNVLVIGENKTDIEYDATNNYNISVPDGAEKVLIQISTSASDIDEILIDDEKVPSNVKMGMANGIEYVDQQNGGLFNFIQLQFALTNFKEQSFTLPMEYKNQKINIKLYNGSASVGEIAVDNNAETVYFDLQGRKLNGVPEKGIYLVKEGNKVTKVIR